MLGPWTGWDTRWISAASSWAGWAEELAVAASLPQRPEGHAEAAPTSQAARVLHPRLPASWPAAPRHVGPEAGRPGRDPRAVSGRSPTSLPGVQVCEHPAPLPGAAGLLGTPSSARLAIRTTTIRR